MKGYVPADGHIELGEVVPTHTQYAGEVEPQPGVDVRPIRRTTIGRSGTRGAGLARGKTLVRPERYAPPAPMLDAKKADHPFDPWVITSKIVTFWALSSFLKWAGLRDPSMRQAWREKVTLCFFILIAGGTVAFLTVGLSRVLCPPDQATLSLNYIDYGDTAAGGLVGIQGWQYNISQTKVLPNMNFYTVGKIPGTDISNYFKDRGKNIPQCDNPSPSSVANFAAISFDICSSNNGLNGCPLDSINSDLQAEYGLQPTGKQVGYDWSQMALVPLQNFFVIDGNVLNLDPYIAANPNPIANDPVDDAIRTVLGTSHPQGGKDATILFSRTSELKAASECLQIKYYAGHLDKDTAGCMTAQIYLYVSLVVILSLVFSRFIMAFIFSWAISWRLAKTPPPPPISTAPQLTPTPDLARNATLKRTGPQHTQQHLPPWAMQPFRRDTGSVIEPKAAPEVGNDLFTAMLVTCYSEGEDSIRTTLDSLAQTKYPDERKMLFVIADGIITGAGNDKSTPDICRDLMEFESGEYANPEPRSYIAVAQGSKQHNEAKVYAGYYRIGQHRCPMLLVVKCGSPAEQDKPKPGNRGKRDSQLILMNFFSRVTYDDRMTPLDYDLFRKVQYLMNVTPDLFEIVLMVDADTKVYDTSLRLLINTMINDPLIMGLCGETKIANKTDSWVTMIQVYEYYISHHLGKGFESIFGGVTCLPGCFCMYRLKARSKDGEGWVAILTKPEIVQEYSQNVVDTLHQRNLLLLGEDRFLTTLMLRNFPYRKMMFTPKAICKTVVPDQFRVLLSQRRRWINSTVHNLMELVLVRNLCGTFCFSMQFVVFMDLLGTLVLPVAMVLTFVLIIGIATTPIVTFAQAIPLTFLFLVLFSPAILILLTTNKWIYAAWMGIYLLALPIWNFVLPVYSYWHFDDFSWGETRKVTGETKGDSHGNKDGQFDASTVPLKKWSEHEKDRMRRIKRAERHRKARESGRFTTSPRLHAIPAHMDNPSLISLSHDSDSEYTLYDSTPHDSPSASPMLVPRNMPPVPPLHQQYRNNIQHSRQNLLDSM
ncbi:hypothetical protein BZG36_05448 [Bifiguratus adelaidae]|uniref:chitin synthase n=1 Tax=Bifiguratus adelaidae TaxID=1938954 RepID=A0A261XTN6_9FUNG|nr:hypothetical protein BZG36_05448 [Bifiguratus adelaidae]